MKKLDNFLLHLNAWGEPIGLALILAPIVKDLLMHGAREWNLVSIGLLGVIIQVIGTVLILTGKRSEFILDQLTRPKR